VSLSVIRCNSSPLHLQWAGRRGHTEKERKITRSIDTNRNHALQTEVVWTDSTVGCVVWPTQ